MRLSHRKRSERQLRNKGLGGLIRGAQADEDTHDLIGVSRYSILSLRFGQPCLQFANHRTSILSPSQIVGGAALANKPAEPKLVNQVDKRKVPEELLGFEKGKKSAQAGKSFLTVGLQS